LWRVKISLPHSGQHCMNDAAGVMPQAQPDAKEARPCRPGRPAVRPFAHSSFFALFHRARQASALLLIDLASALLQVVGPPARFLRGFFGPQARVLCEPFGAHARIFGQILGPVAQFNTLFADLGARPLTRLRGQNQRRRCADQPPTMNPAKKAPVSPPLSLISLLLSLLRLNAGPDTGQSLECSPHARKCAGDLDRGVHDIVAHEHRRPRTVFIVSLMDSSMGLTSSRRSRVSIVTW